MRDVAPPHGRARRERILAPILKPDSRAVREIALFILIAFAAFFLITSFYLSRNGLKFKQSVMDSAASGFGKIAAGAISLNQKNFSRAGELFREAEETFSGLKITAWFTEPAINPAFNAARAITEALSALAKAGRLFAVSGQNLALLPELFFAANANSAASRPSLTEKLKQELPQLAEALAALKEAHARINSIPESFIPSILRERFVSARGELEQLNSLLESLEKDIPALLALLGDIEPHTFLILLQNNAELRPTGGFIGNFAVIETNDGYITKNEIFDVYASDHELKEILEPPEEIAPVNKRWFLRDSNYSPHFPLSAERAAWFLEHENGPGVDTVIAIDQTVVAELLRISGGVRVPELNQPLTSQNFATVLSYIIEAKLSGAKNPKQILQNFVPAFERAVFNNADPVAAFNIISSAAANKHILAYSKNPEVQDFFVRRGIDGSMRPLAPKEDYLAISHTSVSGNKSDAYIKETINHDTFLKSDGNVINELSITRTHTWSREIEREIQALARAFGLDGGHEIPKNVFEILGRSRNLNVLRIYVPTGAVLEESSDNQVQTRFDPELKRTYFLAKMEVPDSQSRTLVIRYRLPFKLNFRNADMYKLTAQSQAGQDGVTLRKRIFPDSGLKNYKFWPDQGAFDSEGIWNFEQDFAADTQFWSIWGH